MSRPSGRSSGLPGCDGLRLHRPSGSWPDPGIQGSLRYRGEEVPGTPRPFLRGTQVMCQGWTGQNDAPTEVQPLDLERWSRARDGAEQGECSAGLSGWLICRRTLRRPRRRQLRGPAVTQLLTKSGTGNDFSASTTTSSAYVCKLLPAAQDCLADPKRQRGAVTSSSSPRVRCIWATAG